MKICLDVRYRMESGASAYIRELVPAMIRLKSPHRFFAVRYVGQQLPFLNEMEEVIDCPSGAPAVHMTWTLLRLPGLLKRLGIDLYHGMKMPGPYWNTTRTVTSVHSVMRDHEVKFASSVAARAFVHLYGEPMLKRSDRLIAVSRFVAQSVVDSYGVPANRIDVIPHGVADRFRPIAASDARAAIGRFDLGRYLLCVGNLAPVKNHVTAVRAFAQIAPHRPDLTLVIAGGQANPYANIVRRVAEDLEVSERVRFIGFVDGEELVALMNAAEVLFFPSMTEGCPVTLLEAMACGLPVVASRVGGLAEFGEGLVELVDDPKDDTTFARRAWRYLNDPDVRRRASERLVAAATRHRWETAARKHLESYRACLLQSPEPIATPGAAAVDAGAAPL